MKNSYPELITGKELIVETLKNEEEKFSSLLERGMKILDENLTKVSNRTFPGSTAFKLYSLLCDGEMNLLSSWRNFLIGLK